MPFHDDGINELGRSHNLLEPHFCFSVSVAIRLAEFERRRTGRSKAVGHSQTTALQRLLPLDAAALKRDMRREPAIQ